MFETSDGSSTPSQSSEKTGRSEDTDYPTVEYSDTAINAYDLRDAVEAHDFDDNPVAQAGDVIIADDQFDDTDVDVIAIDQGTVAYRDIDTVASDAEDAIDSFEDGVLYLRAESTQSYDNPCGFEIPLEQSDAYVIDYDGAINEKNPHQVAWDTDADVSDLKNHGSGSRFGREHGFDGYAVVSDFEIVER
jgi:hypothetical protein